MKKRNKLIGIRNLAIIIIAFLLLIFISDKLIPVFSLLNNEDDSTNAYNMELMRYEKTPPEKFLAPADIRRVCTENGIDISQYKISNCPIIDEVKTAENYDKNTTEILVIGDSFVWGDASMNLNELFWRKTEQLLRKDGYNCRVKAIAMGGATAYEELEWYKNYLKSNSPDLVVFGYIYNDALIDGSDYQREASIDYASKIPILYPIQKLFPNVYSKLEEFISVNTMYNAKYGEKWKDTNVTVLKGKLREYYQKNFADELDKISKQTGIPAIVMPLPNVPNNQMLKQLYLPLADIYENTSVHYYDCINEFNKFYSFKDKKNLYVNPNNIHPGSASHYFYATYLSSKIKSDFPEMFSNSSDKSLLSTSIMINDCTPHYINLETIKKTARYVEYAFEYPNKQVHKYLFFEIKDYLIHDSGVDGYVKLSFANPISISNAELSDVDEHNYDIYLTSINDKLGYDDNSLKLLPDNPTKRASFLKNKKVTSLCIHLDDTSLINNKIHLKIYS